MKKLCWMLMSFLFLLEIAVGEGRSFSWDFSKCDIKDIVYAVSLDTGISIACDDTVFGTADFKFSGNKFELAFDAFLSGNRLFVEKKDELWVVSKIKVLRKENLFWIDACDLTPAEILEKVSCYVDDVITYESLPSVRMSVHFKSLSESDLMCGLAKRFGSYVVEQNENGFHFLKSMETRKLESGESLVKVLGEDNKIKVDVRNCKFGEVVEKFFGSEAGKGKSFCFLSNCDYSVARAVFEEKDFDSALEKFCHQNGVNVCVKDQVYYFFECVNSKDEILFGERKWICFKLKYSSAQEILSLACKQIGDFEKYIVSESDCFYAKVNDTEYQCILKLIEEIDTGKSVYLVNLKYIRPVEVLNHLPPNVDKSCLFMADDNSSLYFKGTLAAYESFCEQISVCDRPEIRVTYDLLIVQYDETFQNSWKANLGVNSLNFGDRNVISGQLGSILSLNINVVSAFGLNFAAKLQGSIEENKSSIYADTTLHGINGKTINFTNSSTYRYRDNNLDPETGKPIYTGITREIVSGINIQITPYVSGDGIITSNVTASVSRQGIDTSASTGNPPPTTEKIITTEVCSKNGEPVILSGLIQNSLTEDSKGVPAIGKLPGFRKLLNSSEKNKEKSQMVIFLVPRIETENVFVEQQREKKICEKINELLELLEV